nr:hypothetical protein [Ardenticatenales bacterium]
MATHSFVGVDHPRATDPTIGDFDPGADSTPEEIFSARQTLLVNTIQPPYAPAGDLGMEVEAPESVVPEQPLAFEVSLANLGAGHNFPTGFAFARQPWLAITVTDSVGNVLLLSGELDESGDLVETRCNNPTQQIVTQDVDTLRDGQADALSLARDKLGLSEEEVATALLEAGGNEAVLAVLAAQRTRNQALVEVEVDEEGQSIVGTRGGLDGDGTTAVEPGTPCVVNLQTQLFTMLSPESIEELLSDDFTELDDGSVLAGERDAYIQTRVLRRFIAACATDPTSDECRKGPAQAFALIAGQRITLEFNTLPVSGDAEEVTIEVAFRFRNYPPYFLRALAADIAEVVQQPDSTVSLDAGAIAEAEQLLLAELDAQTVTLASQSITVAVEP